VVNLSPDKPQARLCGPCVAPGKAFHLAARCVRFTWRALPTRSATNTPPVPLVSLAAALRHARRADAGRAWWGLQVLAEAWRALAEGGEMHFSDVYCDRRLPDAARTDKARNA